MKKSVLKILNINTLKCLIVFIFLCDDVYGQCPLVASACAGTPISGAANLTIPSGTTYYVASGNSYSGNISFANGTSVLCIEGT
jgi:hypothetical protein